MVRRQVRTVTYRDSHCLAQCTVCDWSASIRVDGADPSTIQRAARRHTQSTGHTVILERTIATHYTAEKEAL